MEKIKNYVETVLQPKLQGDGGWVEFVGLDGAYSYFQGRVFKMPYLKSLHSLDRRTDKKRFEKEC